MDGLFNNIGGKIKKLAKVIFVLELIAFFIIAIALFVESGNAYGVDGDYLVVSGIVYLLVGPIVSLMSSWLLYGFGELIDKTSDNNLQLRLLRNPNKTISKETVHEEIDSEEDATISCPNCGISILSNSHFCPICGEEIDIEEAISEEDAVTIPCPNCGISILSNSHFCPLCGEEIAHRKVVVTISCPNCGASVLSNSPFCHICGEEIV